jgi:hypothetical protein
MFGDRNGSIFKSSWQDQVGGNVNAGKLLSEGIYKADQQLIVIKTWASTDDERPKGERRAVGAEPWRLST